VKGRPERDTSLKFLKDYPSAAKPANRAYGTAEAVRNNSGFMSITLGSCLSMIGRPAKTVRPRYLGVVGGAAGAGLDGVLGELPTA
jgi:hypothetical protein